MRILTIIPLACLLASCWTPGPGQVDPTLYPWHPRNKLAAAASVPHPRIVARGLIAPTFEWQPQPGQPQASYCMISLEPSASSGISVGGGGAMACAAPANPAPPAKPR